MTLFRATVMSSSALVALLGSGCMKSDPPPASDAGDPGLHVETLAIEGGTLDVALEDDLPLSRPLVVAWVRRAAVAVSGYFGRYPVDHVVIAVGAGGDEAVNDGVTYGTSRITVRLGAGARADDLDRDWVLTHEMFHLAFPTLDKTYMWMMEGLSDYLEPIARARAGQLTDAEVWRGYVEGSPRGQPRRGDRGLDQSRSRERIYWGGNTYWLLADLQIREKTGNRRSVDDAIRAILAGGGNGAAHWELAQVLKIGDAATGTSVLADLHAEYGEKPGKVDLDALWKRLGISLRGGAIGFDDSAPLAEIRKSITARAN